MRLRQAESSLGRLPVCTGNLLEGMLTDRDLTVQAVAEGRNTRTTKVHEVMTSEVVYAFENQDVAEATRLMEEHQIRRVVLLNRDKQLVGIVSFGDVAVHIDNEQQEGKTLERVSEPAEPQR
jgi:CBS domain-containing protein